MQAQNSTSIAYRLWGKGEHVKKGQLCSATAQVWVTFSILFALVGDKSFVDPLVQIKINQTKIKTKSIC